MRKALLCLTLAALVFSTSAQAKKLTDSKSSKKQAWKQLFNGRDMDGWQMAGQGRFVVENGLLRTEGNMGLLWYTREAFGNCIIRVVYKTSEPSSNSGIFIRIADKPKDAWFGVHHGYEVQICDGQDEYHRTGAVYSLSKATTVASSRIQGE